MKQLTVAAWQFIGFGSISLGRPAVVGPSERGGRDADTQHPGSGGLRSELAPGRVTAAVLQNPIGHADNRDVFANLVQTWAKGVRAQRPEIDEHILNRFGDNMFGGDFVYSVSRQFVRQCKTPLLVMPGDDPPHPKLIGEEIIELAPNVEALRQWKGPEHLQAAIERVTAFLDCHTPR